MTALDLHLDREGTFTPNLEASNGAGAGRLKDVTSVISKGFVVLAGVLSAITPQLNLPTAPSDVGGSLSSQPSIQEEEHRVTTTLSPLSSTSPLKSSPITCPVDLPFSCQNTTTVEDLCCFEYPGGVILLTQFWDYNPGTGPKDKFTIHGLWPDNCDGTFEQFCDNSLTITNSTKVVEDFDPELLKKMEFLWKDYHGRDDYLWTHEYNKHGTCYKTIQPSCYGETYNTSARQDVYDFFKAAVDLNEELPTYDWLAEEGIVPSDTQTYTKEQVVGALSKHYGYTPFVKCDNNHAITEIWYYHHLKGSLRTANFDRFESPISPRCPATGIKYPIKGSGPSNPTRTLTGTARPTPTDGSLRGFVKLSGQRGCLIKNGKWYSSGTCATYTLTPLSTGSYTLKSNAGHCTVTENILNCGTLVKFPFEFNYDESTKLLSAFGQETWNAEETPKRFNQVPIKLGPGGPITFHLHFET